MSGDICGCHTEGAPGIEGVGAADDAEHPAVLRAAPHTVTQPDVSGAVGDPELFSTGYSLPLLSLQFTC